MSLPRTLLLLAFLIAASLAVGGVTLGDTPDPDRIAKWDWEDEKRHLDICVHPKFQKRMERGKHKDQDGNDIDWQDVIADAAQVWNDLDKTWELHKVDKGTWEDPPICQVFVVAGDTRGEVARTKDCKGESADSVKRCTVVIDRLPGKHGGEKFGDGDDKINPVAAVAHELGHTMRILHVNDGHIMRDGPHSDRADDDPTPSAKDNKAVTASLSAPVDVSMGTITPSGGVLSGSGYTVTIPPGAVDSPVPASAFLTSPFNTQLPDSVDMEYSSMYASVVIQPEMTLSVPATVTLSYAEYFAASLPADAVHFDYLPIVPTAGDASPVSEQSLEVLTRSKDTSAPWSVHATPTIDTGAKELTFSITELKTFGMPDT